MESWLADWQDVEEEMEDESEENKKKKKKRGWLVNVNVL